MLFVSGVCLDCMPDRGCSVQGQVSLLLSGAGTPQFHDSRDKDSTAGCTYGRCNGKVVAFLLLQSRPRQAVDGASASTFEIR